MEMRRKDKIMSEEGIFNLLENGEYGVLSMVSNENKPYGVPVSYVYYNNHIYFHGAKEGHKVNNIKSNENISFCIVDNTYIVPEKFTTKYESIIISGEAIEVDGIEKLNSLNKLIYKYSPKFTNSGKKYIEDKLGQTKVFKIRIKSITGKKGK